MKKKISFISAIMLTMAMSTTVLAETKVLNDVKVYHTNDNTFMSFKSDILSIDGTTFFPMRELLNNLGVSNGDIVFDKVTKEIRFFNDYYYVTFTLGEKEYLQNGVEVEMPVAPFVKDGITYLPIRYVANSLGSKVGFDAGLNQILVTDEKVDLLKNLKVDVGSGLPQFSELAVGEKLVTLHTNYGPITLRFFPEYAPLAVNNFITLAENNYYDGVTFHRVINDFMIQGGDPTATGRGGDSIYGQDFENEVSVMLRHFTGALSMANTGSSTSNGSQFYIVEAGTLSEDMITELEYTKANPLELLEDGIYVKDIYPAEIADKYIEIGGAPYLDFGYTVFGQVVGGMDVVHRVAEVEVDSNDKPLEGVVIRDVTVWQYK